MTMTPQSTQYFRQHAGEWDDIRRGYFGDEVQQAAIARAYLRADMVVADIGAGTGFMSAALAPLVQRVYVVDGSAEMLEAARQNLAEFANLEFHHVDGLNLPFPDDSLDAVFANMYLHHCPDPLAAIGAMARVLRSGGRLVITDMDSHPHEWMKTEMADVWQGFERSQMRNWFQQAGLVNRLVECSGQSCCAESQTTPGKAQVSVFVATAEKRVGGVRESVSSHYGAHARASQSCCTPSDSSTISSCCGENDPGKDVQYKLGYSEIELTGVPSESASFGLGCGNPNAIAGLKPGEVVLDIGSGGGLDAFISSQKVGPSGRVIGVDMTKDMIIRARKSAKRNRITNVEFRLGQAESLPVEDQSVDVIISNCVINLCQDKGLVFDETYRVLRPGGRLEISDMVTDRLLPGDMREDPDNWGSCVFGALPEQEYRDLVEQAGFKEVSIQRSASSGKIGDVNVYSIHLSARK